MWDREKGYFPDFGILLQQFILNCCCVKVWVWGGYRGRAPALSHGWLYLLALHQILCAIILISPSLVHVKLLYHVSIFKDFRRQSLLGQEQLTELKGQMYWWLALILGFERNVLGKASLLPPFFHFFIVGTWGSGQVWKTKHSRVCCGQDLWFYLFAFNHLPSCP